MTITRRKFLKAASAAGLAMTTGPTISHGFDLPGRISKGPHALKAKRWAMVVDMSKCDGQCIENCIGVCHEIHNVPYIPTAEHQVMWLFQEPYDFEIPDRISKRFIRSSQPVGKGWWRNATSARNGWKWGRCPHVWKPVKRAPWCSETWAIPHRKSVRFWQKNPM